MAPWVRALAVLAAVVLTSAQSAVTPLESLDAAVRGILEANHIPGAQLAIGRNGRLVVRQAYGVADMETQERVGIDSLFRIASVSKPVTAAAVLTLVERGRLGLQDKAFDHLTSLKPAGGKPADPRLGAITVQDLLQHAGGWDEKQSFDPMFLAWLRVEGVEFSSRTPPDCPTIIRIMMARPLDFEPGTRTAYSNFGYCVLGAIVEAVAGVPYEQFVRESVLAPLGITAMRLGRTRATDRAPKEVRYYGEPGAPLVPSIFDGETVVPQAYGGYSLEALSAAGAWLASASDLVRLGLAVDGLSSASRQALLDTPRPARPAAGVRPETGLTWTVRRTSEGCELQHAGWLPGSSAAAVFRMANGTVIAVVFNKAAGDKDAFFNRAMAPLMNALGSADFLRLVGDVPAA